jgi:response regulator of citrate/malate metabolism
MKKVLLIDDDSIANFINKKLLEKTALTSEIIVAHGARQAIQILVERETRGEPFPDLIL